MLRPELFEVRFHALHEHTFAGVDDLHLLYIDLAHHEIFHRFNSLALSIVGHGNHNGLQRLAHLQVHLAAQCECHRSDFLRHLHAVFESTVYQGFIGDREFRQMNRAIAKGEITVERVGVERSERRYEQ